MSPDMAHDPQTDQVRGPAARPGDVPKLNLRRMESIQRLLKYGALLLLLIFVGLIALSWFQLRQIQNDIATAQGKRNELVVEIDRLKTEAERLQAKNKDLQQANGKLSTANNTLNEVTESLANQSPQQAADVKQAFEASVAKTEDPKQIPPRIYVQIAYEGQRKRAADVVRQLQKEGYIVPGIENVEKKAKIPEASELRYYQNDTVAQQDIKDIVSSLGRLGIRLLVPKPLSIRGVRPRHYELWFDRDF